MIDSNQPSVKNNGQSIFRVCGDNIHHPVRKVNEGCCKSVRTKISTAQQASIAGCDQAVMQLSSPRKMLPQLIGK
jgi:hypothetical protein